MSEVPKSILAVRVASVQARLIGSVLIILVLLSVAGVLYSVSLSRLNQAMAVLEEVVAQTNVLRAEQQAAVFAETEAAHRAMWEVPLAWGLLIAIAALSTTAIAIRSIAQPVERLTEVAQRLAGGNLEERVQIEWADEFGRLATAFNEMADQLQVSYAGLEQRVAERTRDLSASEKRFRDIAESTADWIWEVDAAGRYIHCSESVVGVLGYTPEEILGKTPFEFMPPDEAARVGEVFAEIAANKQPIVDLENRNLAKDGREVVLLTNGVPILDSEGNLLGYRGVDKDITERKRAEESLKTFVRIQAALFQLSTDLAVAFDEADICRKVVRGLRDTLGYDYLGLFLVDETTGERVLGASAGWLDAPSNWRIPPGHGLSERPLLDGQLHYTPDVTGDPCYVPGLNSGAEVDVPLRMGEEVLGVLVVESEQPNAFDHDDFAVLTAAANQASIAIERARQHQAVKEAEARYRSLFDGVPVGLYRSTPAGQFLDANPALAQMLGYPDRASLLAVNAVDMHSNAEKRRQWQALIEREGVLRSWELQLCRYDGAVIWMEENAQAVRDQDGRVLHYEGSLQDITERKRAEDQLQRYAAELERANEELKAFAYTASHDLRAPLVNLKGFAAELRAALAVIGSAVMAALPHLDENQRPAVTTALQKDLPEALGFIDSSVTRMDSLTKALLKLSRLGCREFKFEPVDMEALVQVALEILAHQIEERQVKVSVGPLPEVVADRASTEQILGNLLGNAVKYLDPDRAGEIEITAERDHDETTFHIRDNGRGIAGEDMDKVFAPFRRAGKQDVPGEGMGLPYVQTLVRRHGGRIWCESQPGKGSTFYFTIPANVKSDS
jgi:PAS domain S-box-containing protein